MLCSFEWRLFELSLPIPERAYCEHFADIMLIVVEGGKGNIEVIGEPKLRVLKASWKNSIALLWES